MSNFYRFDILKCGFLTGNELNQFITRVDGIEVDFSKYLHSLNHFINQCHNNTSLANYKCFKYYGKPLLESDASSYNSLSDKIENILLNHYSIELGLISALDKNRYSDVQINTLNYIIRLGTLYIFTELQPYSDINDWLDNVTMSSPKNNDIKSTLRIAINKFNHIYSAHGNKITYFYREAINTIKNNKSFSDGSSLNNPQIVVDLIQKSEPRTEGEIIKLFELKEWDDDLRQMAKSHPIRSSLPLYQCVQNITIS